MTFNKTSSMVLLAAILTGAAAATGTAEIHAASADFAGAGGAIGEGPLGSNLEAVDFGRVLSGESVSKKITIYNRGDETVTLTRIGFTCGCTIPWITLPSGRTVSPDKLGTGSLCDLAPGDSCKIELEFRPQILTGWLERQVFFYTDDSDRPALSLPVVAEIRPAFTLEPRRFEFGRVRWKEPISREMTIRSAGAGAFRIRNITGLPPFFSCRFEELKDQPVSTWRLTLTLDSKPPAGDLSLMLILDLVNERIRSLNIYGSVTIDPEVVFKADPGGDSINFGVLQQGQGSSAEVDIVNLDPDTLYEIDGIHLESDHSGFLDLKLHTLEAGRRYKLFLRVSPELDTRFFRGTIRIFSGREGLEQRDITFKGWINRSNPDKRKKP